MKEKIMQLTLWAKSNNIEMRELSRVIKMLETGKRADRTETDPIQFPACYLEDEKASAWHNPNHYAWVSLLEDNFEAIKQEALSVFQHKKMDIHPENDALSGYGTWNTFFFYKNGVQYSKNLQDCPITASVLQRIPGVDIAGRTYFSAMTPGIHIKKHCGPHNFKLRTHLGIIAPKEAVIRVGDITQSWPEGRCIVFDDSFEHEVWNRSDETRIVLIVDVWNPILTHAEISALEFIMPEFYQREEMCV